MKKRVFLGPKFECKYMKVGNRLLLAILWPNITSDKPSYSQFNPFLKFSFLFWMKKVSRKWSIWAKFPHLIAWVGLFLAWKFLYLCSKIGPHNSGVLGSDWLGTLLFVSDQLGTFFAWLRLALNTFLLGLDWLWKYPLKFITRIAKVLLS